MSLRHRLRPAVVLGLVFLSAGLLTLGSQAGGSGGEGVSPAVSEEEARRAANDARQKADYLRALPVEGTVDLESDLLKVRTLRSWRLLTYPTGTLPPMPFERARQHVERSVRDARPWPGPGIELPGGFAWQKALVNPNENTWTAVGPTPLDSVGTTNNAFRYGIVAGRVGAEALAVHPTNNNVAYAGFAAGGVWKTTNLLAATPTWTPLWETEEFVTQAVSAITLDPNDADTVYAGTGDWAASDQLSAGIMRSTDAGATWSQLGADVFTPFSPTVPAAGNRWSNQNVKSIAIDPKDSDTLLVGTRYDLYLSNDGGASWQICGFGNNYTDPASGSTLNAINRISDIYLDARGAQTVAYVAVGYVDSANNGNNGVYRFTIPASGCPSWPGGFTTLFSGFPTGTGNGTNGGSRTGRIELAGSTASGSLTLYAQVEDASSHDNEGTWVLRPDGGSTTWTKLSGWNSYGGCSSNGTGQDWYDLFIAVDPTNDKRLFIGHIDVYSATVNGGYTSMTQTNLTDVYGTSCSNYGKVHPDQHAFAWIGTTGDFLVGNDGGVYLNTTGTGSGWKHLNTSFNVLQFYAGQIGPDFAGGGVGAGQWLFGGMQDNGNGSWDSSQSDFEWVGRSVGGDGFFTSFDPLNGTETGGRWMTEYTYGSLYMSTSGANGPFSGGCAPNYTGSADWSTPFLLDTLHCGSSSCSNYVLGEDYVWAASSYSGSCPSWSRISGSRVKTSSGSIITVAVAPSEPKAVAVGTDDGKVWWTESAFSGGNCTLAAANTSSFSCSPNTSASWIDADASNAVLPNRAILQVAFDPDDHDVVYAAVGGFDDNTASTPGHLFQLTRSGSSISVADKTGNLPDVPASAVAVNPHDRKQVFVGTHFGFYYTADVDAATPTWVRYNAGLPNTVIQYLTIDRGPSSDPLKGTTLAAFTYGRGVYVLKLPQPAVDQAPTVTITSPADGTAVDQGTSLSFAGTASDPEDGTLTASLSWSSSIDGSIGSGGSFSTSALSIGTHTITASVTDSASNVGSDAISVTIQDPNGCSDCIDWSVTSTVSYSNQDAAGNVQVQDGGDTLYLEDNTWRRTTVTFDVAANTVLEFEFRSTAQGELHGIGFDENDTLTDALRLFKIYGTQNWGSDIDYTPAYGTPGQWQSFSIPVGTYYTGSSMYLVLMNDHDAGSNNTSWFRNVRVVTPAPGNTAPAVTITSPADGSTFNSGASISFAGTATDTEDGSLSSSLSWTSSIDGTIGSGASFSSSSLSLGSHTITASVTDSGGLSGDDAITVTVQSAPACSVVQDFEGSVAGWTVGGSCSTGTFTLGTPTLVTNGGVTTQLAGDHTSGSGNAAFTATNSSAGVNDVDGGECILTSPTYAVSVASDVSLWFFHGQRDVSGDANDYFVLEMSTNGGSSWTTLQSYGDQTVNAVWTEATSTVAGGTSVVFRVRVSDGTANGDLVEAGLDDVTICAQ